MAYGRERTTNIAAPTQYEKFSPNQSPRAYLSQPELGRYNQFSSQYKHADIYSQSGRKEKREAYTGLGGLYGQAQSNAMQAYADYRDRLGAGSSKGTMLNDPNQLVADPTGWQLPNQRPQQTEQYFGAQESGRSRWQGYQDEDFARGMVGRKASTRPGGRRRQGGGMGRRGSGFGGQTFGSLF
jgi:hypothetical protein